MPDSIGFCRPGTQKLQLRREIQSLNGQIKAFCGIQHKQWIFKPSQGLLYPAGKAG